MQGELFNEVFEGVFKEGNGSFPMTLCISYDFVKPVKEVNGCFPMMFWIYIDSNMLGRRWRHLEGYWHQFSTSANNPDVTIFGYLNWQRRDQGKLFNKVFERIFKEGSDCFPMMLCIFNDSEMLGRRLRCLEGDRDPFCCSARNLEVTNFGYSNWHPRNRCELFNKVFERIFEKTNGCFIMALSISDVSVMMGRRRRRLQGNWDPFLPAPETWISPISGIRIDAQEIEVNFLTRCLELFYRRPSLVSQ